jgi:hypothetical protein
MIRGLLHDRPQEETWRGLLGDRGGGLPAADLHAEFRASVLVVQSIRST